MSAILDTDQDIELVFNGLIQAIDEDDLLEVDPEFQKINPFKKGVLKKYTDEEADQILNIDDEDEDEELEDIDYDDEDFDDEEFDDEDFEDEDFSDFDEDDEDYSDIEEDEDEDSKAFVPRHHHCTHC